MSILIDDLIAVLQRVKEEKGNVPVTAGSFCGTNNGHVHFHVKPLKANKRLKVNNHMNGHGEFVLSIDVAPSSIEDRRKGVKDMERLGYTFYRSQFVTHGEHPKSGLSPCDWHIPW